MKKIICMILSIVMTGLCIVPVFATNDEKYSTGLILDTWKDLINDEHETTLRAIATNRKGDISGDGAVSAVDARKCLRAVARLEKDFDFIQENVADINGDGKLSAVDARLMLQNVAGKIEIVTCAEATLGDGLNMGVVIGPLHSNEGTAYYWQYEIDKDGLTVLERDFDDSASDAIGGMVRKYFAFTPDAKGTYTINFKLANAKQTEIIDEFKCVLIVN